jgi:hypothetical protein
VPGDLSFPVEAEERHDTRHVTRGLGSVGGARLLQEG